MPLNDHARAFVPYPDSPVPGAATGPLIDLGFAAKDIFDVAGYRTGCGSPTVLAMAQVQQRTAPAVQALLDAGARFVGKTVTDELAFSMNGQNAHFGSPINGAAPDRITGGSSSGSASAVSMRLCDVALGTDTGGSVRAPANHCGLVGIRPTHGRISLEGVMPLAPSLDTCGWFARDLPTFARIGDVLLGADPAPLPARPRLLEARDLWALAEPGAAAALRPAARRAVEQFGAAAPVDVVLESVEAMYWNFRYIQGHEAWQTCGPLIERHAPSLGPGVRDRFQWSRNVTDEQILPARDFRQRFRRRLADLLGSDGMLILPTMPDIAPLVGDDEIQLEGYRNRAIQLLCCAGLSGFPQLSLPLAMRDGAPLGLSLLGPPGSDRSLIAHAARLWPDSDRRP